MTYLCLIVEDEPLSQDVLKKYIDDCPMLQLAAVCSDAFEATNVLNSQQIDILFLDINMPKLSGIKFLQSLPKPPLVIFTTAYPEYAVDGFNLNAVDYLLKPYSFERFLQAVNKAIEKLQQQKPKTLQKEFITVKADKKIYKLATDDIYYLEAYGDYIKIILKDKTLLIHDTFKNFLNQLPEQTFVRIHKSYAINTNKIEFIEGNQVRVFNQLLPISLSYKDELLGRL